MASNADAKKAVYDAVYNAAMAGKPISQGAANKIYDKVMQETAPKKKETPLTVKQAILGNTVQPMLGQNALSPAATNAMSDAIKVGAYTPPVSTTKPEKTNRQKYEEAKTAYDSYMESEEYQQKLRDAMKPYLLGNGATASTTPYGAMATAEAQKKEQAQKEESKDAKKEELGALAAYYKQQMEAEENQKVLETDLQELATWSDEDRRNLDEYIVEQATYTKALNPFANQVFANPIVNKYGIDKVRQMAESVRRSRNAEITKKVQQTASNIANNNPVAGGIAGSILSVPASLAGSITSPLSYAVELGQRTGRYSTLDPNNIGNVPSVFSETVRGEVAGNIRGDENNTNWMRELAAIGYQGGMSALDSAARVAASGGSAGISAAIASSGAFGSTLRSASQQGAAPAQAAAMALTNAGLEYITEKIPTEKVLDMFKKGNTTGAVKNILQQAFLVEPTSEEVNLFAGVAAEALILGDKSSNNQRLGELIANGMSYEEAKAQIYKELWKEAAQTYAVSAFSGGLSATGATLAGNATQRLAEMTGAELAQNAPAPAPAQPMTENQRHLENGIAATMGVDNSAQQRYDVENNQEGMLINGATNDYGANGRNAEVDFSQPVAGSTKNGGGNVPIGNPGGLSGTESQGIVYTRDSEGREVSPYHYSKIQGTAVRDANGAPIAMYHFTDNMDFDVFNDGDVGFHFGTQEQANKRSTDKKAETGRTFRAYLNIKNPVRVNQDIMGWHPAGTALRLWSDGVLTEAEMREITGLYKSGDRYNSPSASRLREILESKGFDGIAYPNAYEGQGDSYIAFHDDQIVRTGIENTGKNTPGVGAAEQDFSGKAQYQDLLYEGNVQPDRATDVRPMEVPKTDVHGDNVSQTAANVYGSKITPDELASLMEVPIAQGDFSYMPISNDQATEMALDTIAHAGNWTNAYSKWKEQVVKGNAGAEMSARGALLLNKAAKDGNKDEWLDTLRYMQKLGTNTAQGLQAMRLVRELTPPDKIVFMEAIVNDLSESYGMQNELQIDPELVNDFNNAKTDKDRDAVINEIQIDIAKQIPSTFLDKWTALRYTNMLGNLKTQVRNLAGNVGSMAVYRMKDAIATGMEAIANKVNSGKVERTKSFTVSKELRKACNEYFNQDKLAVTDGGKFGERLSAKGQFEQGIQDQRVIFKSNAQNPTLKKVGDIALAPLEGYRRATNWMMNNEYFGDEAFGRVAYVRAMAGYLKAHGVNGSDLSKISSNLLNDARRYAVKEAQEATFHDNSELAKIASKIQKATGVIGQGVMPFTKTPANILTRAVEFSPIGLIDSTVKTIQTERGKTELTGADIVNSWAKTITGTGLFILGAALFDQGLLAGGPDDDDEKEQFDAMNGAQNYAIKLPDGTSYTIDWLTPAAMPLFMGAQFWKLWASEQDITLAEAGEAFTSIADPMVQMSMLQGLNDTLDGIKYSENNFGQFLLNSSVSYLTQGLTNTLMGQIERSTEENRQTTFVDKDSNVPQWLQKQMGKASQKILGWDYQQTDYRNAWGETEENEGGLLYNLLSPGYLSKEEATTVSDELYRLREATGENVFPKSPEKTLEYTDKDGNKQKKNLTAEEYETLQRVEGQTAARVLNEVTTSADYAALSDAQKAKVADHIYDYAREQGRVEAVPDYIGYKDSWMKNISGKEAKTIVNKVVGADIKGAMDAMSNAWANDFDDAEPVEALEAAYTVYSNMSQATRKAVKDDATGRVAAYMEARNNRIKTETFVDLYKTYWELDKSGKKQKDKAEQWAYTLEKAQESGKLTATQKDALKESLGFSQTMRVETEKFDALSDSGLSANDTQTVTKAINSLIPEDGKSKVSDIQKWDAICKTTLDDVSKDAAIKTYMQDYDPTSSNPVKTELKYDYVRQEMDLSPESYTKIYKAYTDVKNMDSERLDAIGTTRKEEYYRRWTAEGMTRSQATELYNLFVTNGKKKIDVVAWYEDQQ